MLVLLVPVLVLVWDYTLLLLLGCESEIVSLVFGIDVEGTGLEFAHRSSSFKFIVVYLLSKCFFKFEIDDL
jgi:hypothetical protein